jgi:hypothetical protein
MTKQKVPGAEVAELFRQAIRGELSVKLLYPEHTWKLGYAGYVEFRIGDWRVNIFNDSDELDYCGDVTAPDGREGDIDDWFDSNSEPTDLLEPDEHAALKKLLEQAR